MQEKILVAYASRTGSTQEVAEFIADVLREDGTAIDVHPLKKVKDVSPYRAVVVGSAIYMGRWMKDAVKFLQKHQDALSRMPVAYFTVCLTLKDDTDENRKTVAAYLEPLEERFPNIQPVDSGFFAGRMDSGKLSFLFRAIVKKMEEPDNDYRNWEAIREWAAQLRPLLLKK